MDKDKILQSVLVVAIIGIICVALYWLLLGVKPERRDYDDIQNGLANIDAEQRNAAESIGRVTDSIERSEASAERTGDSIDRSEDITRDISDGIRRNDEAVRDALDRIADAESRKRKADAGIEKCESRISDGIRCNNESKSIFDRYEKGN